MACGTGALPSTISVLVAVTIPAQQNGRSRPRCRRGRDPQPDERVAVTRDCEDFDQVGNIHGGAGRSRRPRCAGETQLDQFLILAADRDMVEHDAVAGDQPLRWHRSIRAGPNLNARQGTNAGLIQTDLPGDRGPPIGDQQGTRLSKARTCSATKTGLPATRAEPGVVTTRQTQAVARPANASAARARDADARRDLGASAETDDLRPSDGGGKGAASRRARSFHWGSLAVALVLPRDCSRLALSGSLAEGGLLPATTRGDQGLPLMPPPAPSAKNGAERR